MAAERVRVKEEAEWSGAAAGLCAEHEVKRELVLGPQGSAAERPVAPNSDEECIVKQEAAECCVKVEDSGQAWDSPQASTDGAEEAEWSGVSAAAARAGLYDEHEVKHELVLGPERTQPQDIAYTLPVACNRAEECVEQEPVLSSGEVEGTGGSASPAQNLHLSSCLEQLVHRTCFVRLERTPVRKEQLTCQTLNTLFDLSTLLSDRNKHAAEETDLRRKVHKESEVHSEIKSYICDYCGKQFARKAHLIKHVHIHIQQNEILKRVNSEQLSVKDKLMKRERPRCGEQVALRACFVRLQRLPADSEPRRAQHQAGSRHTRAHKHTSPQTSSNTQVWETTLKHSCTICKKAFSTFSNLTKHAVKHIWEEPFNCDICKQSFSQKSELSTHIKQVHTAQYDLLRHHKRKKPFSCEICEKQFTRKGNLITHMKIHMGDKPFTCEICKKQFAEKSTLIEHIRIHTEAKAFSCEICKKQFTLKSNLITHITIHTGEKPFSCEICKKQFTYNCLLITHMRIHTGEKPFACEICKKQFTLKNPLVRHMRIHTGEKPFACEICKKQFAEKSTLIKHMRVHTEEKPFSCDICKKQFTQRSSLITHIRIHTEEKPFSCEICMKQFTQKSSLIMHMRIHTGEKPVTCEICKKQFRHKSHLITHMTIHTGGKPFSCGICKKQFTQKSNLIRHMTIHTEEKHFSCEICKKQFLQNRYLQKHMRIHLKEKS